MSSHLALRQGSGPCLASRDRLIIQGGPPSATALTQPGDAFILSPSAFIHNDNNLGFCQLHAAPASPIATCQTTGFKLKPSSCQGCRMKRSLPWYSSLPVLDDHDAPGSPVPPNDLGNCSTCLRWHLLRISLSWDGKYPAFLGVNHRKAPPPKPRVDSPL
jgi:hypothetical protein